MILRFAEQPPGSFLEARVTYGDAAAVIEFTGEFRSLLNPDPFADSVRENVGRLLGEGQRAFVIDISNVHGGFPDSAHMGGIFRALKHIQEANGKLSVVLNAKQIEMWKHFKLEASLPCHGNVPDALAALGS